MRFVKNSEKCGEKFIEEIIDLVMMCGGEIMFKENIDWKDGEEDELVIHGLCIDSPDNPKLFLLNSKKTSHAKIKKKLLVPTISKFSSAKKLLEHLKTEINDRAV